MKKELSRKYVLKERNKRTFKGNFAFDCKDKYFKGLLKHKVNQSEQEMLINQTLLITGKFGEQMEA